MPWTVDDVDRHKKGLSAEQKRKWVRIANNILKECQETKGGDDCKARAIRAANANTSKDKSGDSSNG